MKEINLNGLFKFSDHAKEWLVIAALVLGIFLMWLFPSATRIKKVGGAPTIQTGPDTDRQIGQ